MEKKYTYIEKSNGQTLTATEWNNLAQDVSNAVDAINNGGVGSSTPVAIDASGVVSVNSKGNTTISASKNINLEPTYDSTGSTSGTYGDVQIKPGDDITLESHHRASNKRDEITIKTSNGQSGNDKAPVKLQVIASDMTLSSKGKTGKDSDVMNVNVTTGSGKGYLKVRARAIDLRCEEHGGIAIQPMGSDSKMHMNKIKFEHGGGDGLEFGTFNTEKTSIFTDEYRFNKNGVWKMATRTKLDNTSTLEGTVGVTIGNKKYIAGESDETQHFSYKKADDDFYDNIDVNDEQCTTKDIIKTAYALNGGKNRHTKITNKGAIEIATEITYAVTIGDTPADPATAINISTISTKIATLDSVAAGDVFNSGDFETTPTESTVYTNGTQYFSFTIQDAPAIKIDSAGELKLGGILDFGSSFNFGETDNGIEVQYKLTKKNAEKDCGVLKVVGINNHATNNLVVEGVTVAPGETATIAQCSLLDVVKLVNYMKNNHQGPWGSTDL